MPRIAIIGAGGFVFPLTLIRDMLAFPELRGATLILMDIDAARLQHTHTSARQLAAQHIFQPTSLPPPTAAKHCAARTM